MWYRIVQDSVINTQEVQGYAAKTCFEVKTPYIISNSVFSSKGTVLSFLINSCVCVCVCIFFLVFVGYF